MPDIDDSASVHVFISGHVQGVFFRAFVAEKATKLRLAGWVRNLATGRDVEVVVEGEKNKLEQLLKLLEAGPPAARVDKVDVEWSEYTGKYSDFQIVQA